MLTIDDVGGNSTKLAGEFQQQVPGATQTEYNVAIPGHTWDTLIHVPTNTYINILSGSSEPFVEKYWEEKNGFLPQTFHGRAVTKDKKGLHFICDYADLTSGNLIIFNTSTVTAGRYLRCSSIPVVEGFTYAGISGGTAFHPYSFDPEKRYFIKVKVKRTDEYQYPTIWFVYAAGSCDIFYGNATLHEGAEDYLAGVSSTGLLGVAFSDGQFFLDDCIVATTSGYSTKSFIMATGKGKKPYEHRIGNEMISFTDRWHNNELKTVVRDIWRT